MKTTRLFFAMLACAALALTSCSKDKGGDPKPGIPINGVHWAECNVAGPGTFAATAQDAGMLYQWSRKIGWSATNPMTSSPIGKDWDGSNPKSSEWAEANNPCPQGWRLPTKEDFEKLLNTDKVSSEWVPTPATGCKFTDIASGKSVFFPAAGLRNHIGGGIDLPNSVFYWSSTAGAGDDRGKSLSLNSETIISGPGTEPAFRRYGMLIRCVAQ